MSPVFVTVLLKGLYAFTLMAVIAMICAGVIKLIVRVLAHSSQPATVAASPQPVATASRPAAVALPRTAAASPRPAASASPADVSDELAVVVAAACNAVLGAHRIIYLAETNRAANWTTEMRARHHQSHVPHR